MVGQVASRITSAWDRVLPFSGVPPVPSEKAVCSGALSLICRQPKTKDDTRFLSFGCVLESLAKVGFEMVGKYAPQPALHRTTCSGQVDSSHFPSSSGTKNTRETKQGK